MSNIKSKSMVSLKIPLGNTLKKLNENFLCPACRNLLEKPVQAECGHIFCRKCSGQLHTSCPICQVRISNKSPIARNDVEDMRTLLDTLNQVFTRELKNISKPKDGGRTGTSNTATTGTRTSQQTNQRTNVEEEEPDEEAIELVDLSSPPPPNENEEPTSKESSGKCDIKNDKSVTKFKTAAQLHRLMNQKYAILTTSVVPLADDYSCTAMDLSLPRSTDSSIKYKFQTALDFVKPLDLSFKKKKNPISDQNANDMKDDRGFITPREEPSRREKCQMSKSKEMKTVERDLVSQQSFGRKSFQKGAKSETLNFNPGSGSQQVEGGITSSDEMLGNISSLGWTIQECLLYK